MSVRRALFAVWAIATAKFLLHLYSNGQYGYFRDEFDYIACGEHLDWGFVDHPPLIPFLVKLSRILFGDSLRAIRIVPSIAASLIVVQGASIARRLSGSAYAMILTAAAIAVTPFYLSDGSLTTTNCLEPLIWMGCAYCAICAVQDDDGRFWIGFGAIVGLGLEEKYSIAVFVVGIIFGLVLSANTRKWLIDRFLWIGGGVALLIFLPNLIWNIQHHWPFLELMSNVARTGKDVVLSPARFVLEQILLIGPPNALLWIPGLVFLLLSPRSKAVRFLGWSYLFTCAFFELRHGKNYYLAPIYPMLIAAGAVVWETFAQKAWQRAVLAVMLILPGILLIPVTVPILPAASLDGYFAALPFEVPRTEVSHKGASLPQHYADQFGWKDMVEVVAQAWDRIPVKERPQCGIFGQNYGQAGAVDFLGPKYGLPPAISGHQTYFLWGPRQYTGSCLIVIGDRRERVEELFESVEYVGAADAAYAMENRIPVYICRRPRFGTLQEIWPKLKIWR